ncbi:MAG: hypothetical protein H6924_10925 [Alphaproteobacteria bacterium]|nr:hypothetical protein [Alphaproteobacteria bacterium]
MFAVQQFQPHQFATKAVEFAKDGPIGSIITIRLRGARRNGILRFMQHGSGSRRAETGDAIETDVDPAVHRRVRALHSAAAVPQTVVDAPATKHRCI